MQPSSAAAERVFSLLKHSFSDTKNASVQDLIETSLILQYNEHDVKCVYVSSEKFCHIFVSGIIDKL